MENKEIKEHAYAMMYYKDLSRTIYDAVNDLPYDFAMVDDDIPGFEARMERAVDDLHKLGEELDSYADEEERLMWEGLGLDIAELETNKQFCDKIVATTVAATVVKTLLGSDEEDDEDD